MHDVEFRIGVHFVYRILSQRNLYQTLGHLYACGEKLRRMVSVITADGVPVVILANHSFGYEYSTMRTISVSNTGRVYMHVAVAFSCFDSDWISISSCGEILIFGRLSCSKMYLDLP